MQASSPAVGAIFNEWRSNDELVGLAARGILCNIAKKKSLHRGEVALNWRVVAPIIGHLGALSSFHPH